MNDLSIDKIKQLINKFKDKNKALEYLISSFNAAKNKGMKKNIAKLLIVMYFIGFAAKNNRWVDNISASEISQASTDMSDIENMTERELQDFMGDKTYLYDKSETETGVEAKHVDNVATNLFDYEEDTDIIDKQVQPAIPKSAIEYQNVRKLSASQETIDFIKDHEKLRLTAYVLRRTKRDKNGEAILDKDGKVIKVSDGMITVGYGHAEKKEKSKYKEGDKITENKAERLFKKDLRTAENGIKRIFRDWKKQDINIELTQSMYDAMVSMTFNMGVGGMRKTDFIQYIKKGDFKTASNKIKTARIGKFSGVKKRRVEEYNLFLKDIS
jgi:lysozyme